MSTYRNVKAQIAKLEKQAAELYKKEVAGIAAKVRALIDEYALTPEHLGFTGKASKTVAKTRKSKAAAKPAGVPKYRDPVSGKTWTGKGKAPGWIHEGLKQGKSKDDFLIGKKSPATKVSVKKFAKASKPAKATTAIKSAKIVRRVVKAPAAAKKLVAKKPAVVAKAVKTIRRQRAKKPAAGAVVPAATVAAT
jgi:DNA-binding protein H-NS